MICVVLPAAHSALDLCCLHSHTHYSLLHWLFWRTLYWIFSRVQSNLLKFNICFDLMAHSCSVMLLLHDFSERYGSCHLSQRNVRASSHFSNSSSHWTPRVLQTQPIESPICYYSCIPAPPFLTLIWRCCPVCVQFMQGKQRLDCICEEIGVKSTYLWTWLPLEPICDQLFMCQREPRN